VLTALKRRTAEDDLVYQVAKSHGGEDGNHRDGARGGRVATVGLASADICVVLFQDC